MSADLFAEFNQPAKQTPLPQLPQPQPQPQLASYQNPASITLQSSDPFDFGNSLSSNPLPASQKWQPAPQQWSYSPSSTAVSMQPAALAPPQTQSTAEDDDGWGDFEVAENTTQTVSQISQNSRQIEQSPTQLIAWSSTASVAPVRATDNPFPNTTPTVLREIDDAWLQPKPNDRNAVKTQAADSNVLFDAADFELENGEFDGEDDDEFGDFESVKPHAQSPKQSVHFNAATPQMVSMPSIDLLSLDDAHSMQNQQCQPHTVYNTSTPLRSEAETSIKSETTDFFKQEMNFGSHFESPKPNMQLKSQPTSTPWAAVTNDDDWGAWDETTSANTIESTEAPVSWDWSSTNTQTNDANTTDSHSPPVTVPPPSILLSLFPELLSQGNALTKKISGANSGLKDQIISNPKTLQFLQGYILLATTAARIMAGRKHRWHRDKRLAKSMSISTAGSKGMKLAGVDKTQTIREDREAADVMTAWMEQVGRLRSAVTAANASAQTKLKVPELSEAMSVHTAKVVATAPKPCVICGLKRDERITKVDFEVEDSFGEWWVEHWGHRACKNFWIEHENRLRQR